MHVAPVEPACGDKPSNQGVWRSIPEQFFADMVVCELPDIAARSELRGGVPEEFEEPDRCAPRDAKNGGECARLRVARGVPLQG
jgi:hypothetical protein